MPRQGKSKRLRRQLKKLLTPTCLLDVHHRDNVRRMSTVAEIENAIERLSHPELSELARWFEEYQQMISASGEMFALYDREEEESCRKPNAGNCG